MKGNKTAFTLGEVLIVFVAVGIIATIGIATIKPWERAYKYAYTRIYNGLTTSIYNHMVTTAGADAFPETPSGFCNALIEYLNTSNNAENDSAANPCNLTGGNNNFLDNNPALSDFLKNGKNPKIRLSNGAYLWIGADFSDTANFPNGQPFYFTQTIDATTTDIIRYYLVYADLNGDMGPNTASEPGRRLPDIVAFAVTDKFAVVPLGYPKVDQRYLSAHIMYPISEENDLTDEGERPSDSMTYYEAIVGAYGKSPNKIVTFGLPQTYDLEESLPATNIFKMVGSSLDSFYANAPTFDQTICGDGYSAAEIINNGTDSYCSVKIYNYN